MNNRLIPESRVIHDCFGRFSALACGWLGSTWAFLADSSLIVIWALVGPIFHFAQHWLQVIDTGTNIATFLMVFLIQNTQNCDAAGNQLEAERANSGSRQGQKSADRHRTIVRSGIG